MASPTPPTTNVKWLPRYDDTDQRLLVKLVAVLTAGLGLGGVDIVTDSVTRNGSWVIIHAIQDTVIASVTYAGGTSTGSLAGQTLKAGDRVYGQFLSVTLTSGAAELYRATI